MLEVIGVHVITRLALLNLMYYLTHESVRSNLYASSYTSYAVHVYVRSMHNYKKLDIYVLALNAFCLIDSESYNFFRWKNKIYHFKKYAHKHTVYPQ